MSQRNVVTKQDRSHTHAHQRTKIGAPKKEGAGGKGTWGKEGSEIHANSAATDPYDPNYDSEDDGYVPAPPPPLQVFKVAINNILDEYFTSGDADEVARALKELNHPEFQHEFVKYAVSRSLDLHDRERELTSELLPRLYPDVISHEKVVEGFTCLLERMDDLSLDIPNASDLLAMFLARAVVDDLLPPAFLSPDSADVELAKETLRKAAGMIQGKGAFKRAQHIWGPAGDQSVKKFKERVESLLQEYLVSTDIVEADRAVRELDVPSFHYQVVKKSVILALDSKESDRDKIVKLLSQFSKSDLISQGHMVAGFKCCVDTISDIELDNPNARELLRKFIERSIQEGYLPSQFAEEYSKNLLAHNSKGNQQS
jgi:hypothetical protein